MDDLRMTIHALPDICSAPHLFYQQTATIELPLRVQHKGYRACNIAKLMICALLQEGQCP